MLWHSKGYQKSITLIETGHLNKQYNTNMNTSEEREETRGETDINMCSLSVGTSTYTINNKPSYIHPVFIFYIGSQINNKFNSRRS